MTLITSKGQQGEKIRQSKQLRKELSVVIVKIALTSEKKKTNVILYEINMEHCIVNKFIHNQQIAAAK